MNSDYDYIFDEVGKKYGIDPLFLKAHAQYESRLDPNFKNPDSSASGLTAFTKDTAKDYNVDTSDPYSSIDGQARYLLANYEKFKDSKDPVTSAVSAYKTGPNAKEEDPDYVNGVMDYYKQLKHGQETQAPKNAADAWESKINEYAPPAKQNDLGYKNGIPSITVRPASVPVQQSDEPEAVSETPQKTAADDWESKIQAYNTPLPTKENAPDNTPQGSYNKKLSEARQAMSEKGSGIPGIPGSEGVPAMELGYLANLETSIPFLPDVTSAGAAAVGVGEGKTFSERMKSNEQTQQAYRQSAEEISPGANELGKAGAALVTAPLMPGVGAGATTVGGRIAAGAANGALYGGAYGLSSGDASQDIKGDLETRLVNSGKGAATGLAIGAAVPAVLEAGRGAANMLVRSSSPSIVNGSNALHEFTDAPVQNLDLNTYVPGSHPTMGNAAAYARDPNAGNVAALERNLSESKAGGSQLYTQGFADRIKDNNEARRDFVMKLAGEPDDITKLQRDRSKTAKALLGDEAKRLANPTQQPKGSVWQNNQHADPTKVIDYVDAVKKGPASGNEGLIKRLNKIQTLLEKGGSDPQYIYESVIKPQLNDFLESTNPFTSSQATASQLPYLREIHSMLSNVVSDAAPGFNAYKAQYAQDSRAVERLQALQSLKLINPEVGEVHPTIHKVNNALAKVQEGRANIDGTDPWKSLTKDDVSKLVDLQKDLARDHAGINLIKPTNSVTNQNQEITKKVTNMLQTEPPIWPRVVGGGIGASVGGTLGAASGLPGVGVGITTGAMVGERAGDMFAKKISHRGTKTAVDLSDLLLNPKAYAGARQAAQTGVNNLNPFNQQGSVGRFLGNTNYGPAVGYGANRLVQFASPQPQVNK